ncbi:MAG: hypothetical protein Q8R88_00375 [Desulfoprunum sp.]|nr:hypothetical protein [Desulfoprunum sp.]
MNADDLAKNFNRPVIGTPEELDDQARADTRRYFKEAADDINLEMGEGTAQAHPELVVAWAQIRGQRQGNLMVCMTLQEGFSVICNTLVECSDEIAYLLKKLKEAL